MDPTSTHPWRACFRCRRAQHTDKQPSSALGAVYIYGYRLRDYHNLASAGMAWGQIMVGERTFDYQDKSDLWTFSVFFFILFVFLVVIVGMNVFIAILSESYESAKEVPEADRL